MSRQSIDDFWRFLPVYHDPPQEEAASDDLRLKLIVQNWHRFTEAQRWALYGRAVGYYYLAILREVTYERPDHR